MRAATGVICLDDDTPEELDRRMAELLDELLSSAGVRGPEEVLAAVLGATPDVTAGFPATAARNNGLESVAVIGLQLQRRPDAPARQVQVLLHLAGDGPHGPVLLRNGATLT